MKIERGFRYNPGPTRTGNVLIGATGAGLGFRA